MLLLASSLAQGALVLSVVVALGAGVGEQWVVALVLGVGTFGGSGTACRSRTFGGSSTVLELVISVVRTSVGVEVLSVVV
ncbi:ADM_collapsed_G0026250.mRNA.1.CDS.1 [Saccharomyces cerevisiae]|nr:ADM_collapsed_G0026250.mRNA.1.CDS.1 [Saccharomyces cerevisiae]